MPLGISWTFSDTFSVVVEGGMWIPTAGGYVGTALIFHPFYTADRLH